MAKWMPLCGRRGCVLAHAIAWRFVGKLGEMSNALALPSCQETENWVVMAYPLADGHTNKPVSTRCQPGWVNKEQKNIGEASQPSPDITIRCTAITLDRSNLSSSGGFNCLRISASLNDTNSLM
jgi:hypothetical protein